MTGPHEDASTLDPADDLPRGDTADLQASLAQLAGLVTGSFGLEQLLERVATYAARAVPGADGPG